MGHGLRGIPSPKGLGLRCRILDLPSKEKLVFGAEIHWSSRNVPPPPLSKCSSSGRTILAVNLEGETLNLDAFLAEKKQELDQSWDSLPPVSEIDPTDSRAVEGAFEILHRQGQGYRRIHGKILEAKSPELFAKFRSIILRSDEDCRSWLKTWTQRHGWPKTSLYGEEVGNSAWLVGLQSDIDLPFQKWVAEEICSTFEGGECSPVPYAGILDRVAINEGQLQNWRMFYFLEEGVKKYYPHVALDRVEKNRAEIGLQEEEFHR